MEILDYCFLRKEKVCVQIFHKIWDKTTFYFFILGNPRKVLEFDKKNFTSGSP